MGITNSGLRILHGLVSGETDRPTHISFATGSDEFTGTETSLASEFLRKEISWDFNSGIAIYSVVLSSGEGNGSDILTSGLFTGSSLGSDTIFSFDKSYIGSKNDTFNAQIEGEIIYRRPI